MRTTEVPGTTKLQSIAAVDVTSPTVTDRRGTLAAPIGSYEAMRKSIRSWAAWTFVWAVVSMLPGMNFAWGILLAVLALMSLYFYDVAGMFIVYAGIMLWAAVSNALTLLQGDPGFWPLLAIAQVAFAVSAIRAYRRHRPTVIQQTTSSAGDASADSASGRETRLAPVALILGALSVPTFCSVFAVGVALSAASSANPPAWISAALVVPLELGVLALPAGLAARIPGYGSKGAAVAAIVLGSLCILLEAIMVILAAGA